MDIRLVTDTHAPEGIADDAPLRAALDASGLAWTATPWNADGVDWGAASITLLRTPWDYPEHLDTFLAWAEGLPASTRLWNAASVLRWNIHKGYLLELERAGVPIVPTQLVPRGETDLDGVRDRWADRGPVVVKPAIGANARGTVWFDDIAAAESHLRELLGPGDVLVQTAVEEIRTEGELSIVQLDGAFTHTARKRPGTGDFRVQENHGGRLEPAEPHPASLDLARRACEQATASLDTDLVYARVDLVETADGPQLMELELIEPELFLRVRPEAATRLVDGLRRRLDR